MKRCRHPADEVWPFRWGPLTVEHVRSGCFVGEVGDMRWFRHFGEGEPHRLWCGRCQHSLPLGPARDNIDAVMVEMRAAELAVGFEPMSGSERTGWEDYIRDTTPLTYGNEAGWLAHAIATHEEE